MSCARPIPMIPLVPRYLPKLVANLQQFASHNLEIFLSLTQSLATLQSTGSFNNSTLRAVRLKRISIASESLLGKSTLRLDRTIVYSMMRLSTNNPTPISSCRNTLFHTYSDSCILRIPVQKLLHLLELIGSNIQVCVHCSSRLSVCQDHFQRYVKALFLPVADIFT